MYMPMTTHMIRWKNMARMTEVRERIFVHDHRTRLHHQRPTVARQQRRRPIADSKATVRGLDARGSSLLSYELEHIGGHRQLYQACPRGQGLAGLAAAAGAALEVCRQLERSRRAGKRPCKRAKCWRCVCERMADMDTAPAARRVDSPAQC